MKIMKTTALALPLILLLSMAMGCNPPGKNPYHGSTPSDPTPPTLDSIDAPSDGTTVGIQTIIRATASDNVGVNRVEYFLDGTTPGDRIFATPSGPTYQYSWNTSSLADGSSHDLYAQAYDDAGNSSAPFGPVTVTIDKTAPTCGITSPLNGASVMGTINIVAAANDANGISRVEFYIDDIHVIPDDALAPYQYTWNTTTYANGTHKLKAIAYDGAGNSTGSGEITVTVDNSAPTVSIVSPASGAFLADTVLIQAPASDNIGVTHVDFIIDGGAPVVDNAAPYQYSWDSTSVSNGAHTIRAVAYDAAGNTTSTGVLNVTVDNIHPVVNVTSPVNGTFQRGTVTLRATVVETNFSKVEFYIDGVFKGNGVFNAGNYELSWVTTTGYTNGSHSIMAKAYDLAGNTTIDNDTSVTVDNLVPSVNITAPANGAKVNGTVTINASASDANMDHVEFWIDGLHILAADDSTAPYQYAWDTSALVDNTVHNIRVIAYDKAGNMTANGPIPVTIDKTNPTVSITSPVTGAFVNGTIVITTNPVDLNLSRVEFYDGATLLGTATGTPWSLAWNAGSYADGTAHSLTARAYDAANNFVTSAAVNVTVDKVSPTANVLNPTNGAKLKGVITLRASASDPNAHFSKVDFYRDNNVLLGTGVFNAGNYELSWDWTGLNGTHSIKAVAYDLAGNTYTDNDTTVIVDEMAPTVSVTNPANGSSVKGTITITANAFDNDSINHVEFWIDGVHILAADDLTAPYTYSWDTTALLDGAHTVRARAYDDVGNFTDSAINTANVDNTAPSVNITAPATPPPTTYVRGNAVNYTANASADTTKVQFYIGGVLKSIDSTAPYGYTWNTTVGYPDGVYNLVVHALDAANNDTASANFNVTVDNTVPSLASIISPLDGTYTNTDINIQANVTDNYEIDYVEFRDGLTLLSTDNTDSSGPWPTTYSYLWNIGAVAEGSHPLTITAWDKAGNSATSSIVNVTIDKSAPSSVNITAPANNSYHRNNITISADITDNIIIDKVEFYDGAALLSTDNTDNTVFPATYSYVWNIGAVPDGAHTISVKAYDKAGNSTTSTVNVTIDKSAPIGVAITSHGNGDIVSGIFNVEASAADGNMDRVDFYIDAALVGNDGSAPYQYSWNTNSLVNGTSHIMYAVAWDLAGNSTTSATVTVVVDRTIAVDNSADAGEHSVIGINGGNVYIVYYDATNADLKFAKSTDDGATWPTISAIDNAVGNWTASERNIAMKIIPDRAADGDDIYLAYYDQPNGNLMFKKSVNGGTGWSTVTIDGAARSGFQVWGFSTIKTVSSASGIIDDSTAASFLGTADMNAAGNHNSWGTSSETFTINVNSTGDITVTLDTDCTTEAEVIAEINTELVTAGVAGVEAYGDGFGHVGIRTTVKGSSQSFDITNPSTALLTLGWSINTYTGTDGTAHTATITVDGTARTATIYGISAATIGDVITEINADIGAWATASFDPTGKGFIRITSITTGAASSISIADTSLFSAITDANGSPGTAIAGYAAAVVGTYPSIAVVKHATDPAQDRVYISYYDGTSFDLKLAYSLDGGTAWTSYALDATGDVGQYTYLAAAADRNSDNYDDLYIVYYDLTNTNLKYAKFLADTTGNGCAYDADWTVGNVESSANDLGRWASLAVLFHATTPASDRLYVSFFDATAPGLKMAYSLNGASAWSTEFVESGNVGEYTSIMAYPDRGIATADSFDDLYISYYDLAGRQLKYAQLYHDAALPGGHSITDWTTSVVDHGYSYADLDNNAGQFASLAVVFHAADAAQDKLYISYYDVLQTRLKIARSSNGGAAW